MPLRIKPVYEPESLPIDFSGAHHDYNCYELTMTFNPQLWNKIDAFNNGIRSFYNHIVEWLNPHIIVGDVMGVVEFQKSGMPHLHLCILSVNELSVDFRFGVIKAINRLFGRASFKRVIDTSAYYEYMSKDLETNYKKLGGTPITYYSTL